MEKAHGVSISDPTNGGKNIVEFEIPYIVNVSIEGTSDLLLHAWNVESIDAKAKARKGSDAKKTDDVESYVRRNEDGQICLPGEYLRMSIINAAKFRQDPRSPRKSAMDLYKAAIVSLDQLCHLVNVAREVPKTWDFEHRCRVQVQRSGITRCRPAFHEGWKAEASILVNLPEYVSVKDLHETITMAGRVIGVGDFRPTYGRFRVVGFAVQSDI